jgi:hypothetical protein
MAYFDILSCTGMRIGKLLKDEDACLGFLVNLRHFVQSIGYQPIALGQRKCFPEGIGGHPKTTRPLSFPLPTQPRKRVWRMLYQLESQNKWRI